MAIEPDAPTSPLSPAEAPIIENELPTYRALQPLAVVSLLLGVLSVLCFAHDEFLVLAVAAVVTGALADRAIRRLPHELTGRKFAQAGITMGLIFGLGSMTSEGVQKFLRRHEGARFARGYAKLIEGGSLAQCLWYRLPPETRKDLPPDQAMEQLQQATMREPMMYQEQVRPLKKMRDRVALGAKISYARIASDGLDGLSPVLQVILKVEGPDAGPEEGLLAIKGSPGRPIQWTVDKIVFPYPPRGLLAY